MFLQRKGTSWSGNLLRDELFHAGIRHSRTRLDGVAWAVREAGEEVDTVPAVQVNPFVPDSASPAH